jgi:hypothetical protein
MLLFILAKVLTPSDLSEGELPPPVTLLPYEGKYEGDPRFDAVFGDLQTEADDALARAMDDLGVGGPSGWSPTVAVVDASSGLEGERYRGPTGVARGLAHEVSIELRPEYFLVGHADLGRVLEHEMVHAIVRSRIIPGGDPVPEWLVEGMAVWAADEVETKLNEGAVAEGVWGFSDSGHPYAQYALQGQMVACVDELYGREAVHALAFGMAKKRNQARSRKKAIGTDFEADVMECVRGQWDASRPAELEAIEGATKDAGAGAKFLLDHPTSPFAPTIEKSLALNTGDEELLLAATLGPPTSLDDQIWLALAVVRHMEGDIEGARAALETQLLDYPWSPSRELAQDALRAL